MRLSIETRRWGRAVAPLLAMATVLASASAGCGSDAPLDVAQSVDLGQFQGKWYEIARLPRATQTNCYGTTAFYTQAADGSLTFVNQCNTDFSAGPIKTVSMKATVPDTAVPAKLSLDVGGISGDYWILEVAPDYGYAVVGHPSRSYFWVLSRTPTLDDVTMQGILARAQKNGFDTTKLQYTPQPPDAERLSSGDPVGPVPAPAAAGGCAVSPWNGATAGGAAGCAVLGLGLGLGAVARRRLRSSGGAATIASR